MGLVIWGAILFVIGKVVKQHTIERIGFWMMIAGVVLFGLGFFGISLPIPVSPI